MRVPDESKKPSPETIKVVFGWPAWILFAFIVGGVGSSVRELSTPSYEVQQLRGEVNRLQSDVQQLQSEIDQLLENAEPLDEPKNLEN